jgi:hypothetical protein
MQYQSRFERRRAFVTGIAAALVLVLAVVGAFEFGKSRSTKDVIPTNVDVVNHSEQQVRAARAIASDLAVIERVPEHLRVPLLKSQIDAFELTGWARSVTSQGSTENDHGLASMLLELEPVLESKDAKTKLLHFRTRLTTGPLGVPLMATMTPKGPSRNVPKIRIFRSSELSKDDIDALGRTMMVKQLIVNNDTPSAFCAMVLGSKNSTIANSPLRAVNFANLATFSGDLRLAERALADRLFTEPSVLSTNGKDHVWLVLPDMKSLEGPHQHKHDALLQYMTGYVGEDADAIRWIEQLNGRDGNWQIRFRSEQLPQKKD